jgi:hypothetical protein
MPDNAQLLRSIAKSAGGELLPRFLSGEFAIELSAFADFGNAFQAMNSYARGRHPRFPRVAERFRGFPIPLCLKRAGAAFHGAARAQAGVDIDARNSPLDFVFVRRLSKSSIASTVERGLKTLRSTQTRLSSSGGRSNSSFRVPER